MAKLKFVIPNLFTMMSLCLGLASMAMSADGNFRLAAWMILWGVLLDKLDGTAARLLKATSKVGGELDSFADFVVFGLAPAALFYFRLRTTGSYGGATVALLVVSCALYVLGTAGRLARFNVTAPPFGDRVFYGVPGTLMGAILASSYLTWEQHGANEQVLIFSPAILVVGAALMVSHVKLPKLKSRRNRTFNAFQIGNVVAAYIVAPLMLFPEYLMALALTYTVVGILWCRAFPPEVSGQKTRRRELAT